MALDTVRTRLGIGGPITPPDGSEVGDAAIILTSASTSSLGTGGGQFYMTLAPDAGGPELGGAKFYLGVLTSLDPIDVIVTAGTGVRSTDVMMLTTPGTLDTGRMSLNSGEVDVADGGIPIPKVGKRGAGLIFAAAGWRGIGGSRCGNITDTGMAWTSLEGIGEYHSVGASFSGDPTMPSAGTAVLTGTTNPGWIFGMVIGVDTWTTGAPPCRLIRDDQLGVGGARLYPPPRSQQGSSRGVGYY